MSTGSQQPASGWTEPPWSGWIETTGDALLILEAARRGVIPRVTRRLVDSERKMITSGSVFVFDEDESGIKRWTDGLFWSPSRILGNFLLYRETDKRGAGHRRAEPQPPEPEASVDASDADPQSLSRPKGETSRLGIDRQRERVLVGSLTNSYKFKPNGLMKKVSKTGFVSLHLDPSLDVLRSFVLETHSVNPRFSRACVLAFLITPRHVRRFCRSAQLGCLRTNASFHCLFLPP
jgi:Gti1/Pac2 family transcription factor